MSKVVDKFIILEEIGQGQFSTVHKGKHMVTGELVALKILKLEKLEQNPKVKELVDEEMKALKALDSPFVVKSVSVLKTTNNIYQIFEYCEQGNLLGLLQKRGTLSEREALNIFKDLVMGLRALYLNSSRRVTRHYPQRPETRERIPTIRQGSPRRLRTLQSAEPT